MITKTRKLSDKKIVSVFCELFEALDDCSVTGQYVGGVQFSAHNSGALQELNAKANERLIELISISSNGNASDEFRFARGATLHVKANSNEDPYHYFKTYREADPYFDEVGFFRLRNSQNNHNYVKFSEEEILAGARILQKLGVPARTSSHENDIDITGLFDQNIADLQRVSTEFLERAAASRDADEQALAARLEKLEAEYEKRNTELQEKQTALVKLREELDDREPQHERRKLRKELTSDLQAVLDKPPEGGLLKRNIVYFLYVAVGLVFIAVSVLLTLRIELSSEVGAATFWASTIKAAISGVGGAAFIWAGLSGLKTSTESQRRYSQQLQRYSFDMDRASWVVETLLQMNSIESAQVPEVWLEAACRELFANENTQEQHGDSLTALGALLDASARAKMGTEGFEFELDKKSARRMAKEAR